MNNVIQQIVGDCTKKYNIKQIYKHIKQIYKNSYKRTEEQWAQFLILWTGEERFQEN